MATLVNVAKTWSQCTAGTSITGRTAVEVYTVLFAAPEENLEYAAKTATGVPRVQVDPHPSDQYLIATSSQARLLSPVMVEVAIQYGTPAVAGFRTVVGADGTSQLDLNPEVSWDTITSIEDTEHDINGAGVYNIVGDPITIQRETSDPVLRVTLYRDYASVDVPLINSYLESGGAVSSDAFLGTLAGQAHILKISPQLLYFGTTRYWRVDYEVAFRRPQQDILLSAADAARYAWWDRRPQRGYRVKVSGMGDTPFRAQVNPANDGIITAANHDGWAPTPEMVYLDDNGTRLGAGLAPIWKYTQIYKELPFAGLGVTI